jgi:type I restriction enzyme S subunit
VSFPKYEHYKDSGVEWLGDLPNDWRVSRLGFEAWVRARLGWKGLKADEYVDDGFPMLATPNIKGKHIDFDGANKINKFRFDESPEIKLRLGDVVLAKDGSTLGIVNVVRVLPQPATVNSSIAVITPNLSLNGSFLAYLFQSAFMVNMIASIKGGMGVPHLFQEDLNKFYLPLPPIAHQFEIVTFLDLETTKLDALIAEQRTLIDLLKEKRQAVISHAVTKGLDPRVPMKDSGVEWLGDVPAHWQVVPLKHLVVESVAGPYGASLTKSMYTTSGYRVYGQQQVIPDDFTVGDYYISEDKYQEMRRYTVFEGDVLVSVMGTIGKVAVVPPNAEPGIINPRLVRYQCGRQIRPRFLQRVLMCETHQEHLNFEAKGSTMDGLNMTTLATVPIPVPPVDEQDQILAGLFERVGWLDSLVNEAESAITLLQERRSALISAAVTGKIDVRQHATEVA